MSDECKSKKVMVEVQENGIVRNMSGLILGRIEDHVECAKLQPHDQQIDRLANFIMAEIEGEPAQSEGAGDCAIRIIKTLTKRVDTLTWQRDGAVDDLAALKRER